MRVDPRGSALPTMPAHAGKALPRRSWSGGHPRLPVLRDALLPVLLLAVGASSTFAATYFVGPGGADANSGLSQTAPWKTFAHAWAVLQPGDTLTVLDGDYNEDLSPPSTKAGTASAAITVSAAHDWKAIIHGDASDYWTYVLELGSGNRYLDFEGLKIVTNTDGSGGVHLADAKNNVFRRMSVWCKYEPADAWAVEGCILLNGSANNNLVEDSWVFDKGRYTILLYNAPTGNVFRRVVVRHGDYKRTDTQNPQAGFNFYTASGNTVENMISMDNFLRSDSENSGIYLTGQAVANNSILGSIVLNNHSRPKRSGDGGGASLPAMGIHFDCGNEAIANTNRIENTVVWDNDGLGFNTRKSANGTYLHMTLGRGSGGINGLSSGSVFKNSLSMSNSGNGVSGSFTTEDYNDVYGNGNNSAGGSHDVSVNPGLLYLPRIEASSAVHGTADDGLDRGANVTKRYLNGTVTGADLWPWPYEAQIRADMCAAFSDGWCGTTKTLTEYVWGYLGNPWPPPDLPGGGPGNPKNLHRTDRR